MGGSHQFHMDLGNLEDTQLRQLMEDLQWEVAHRELNVPPRGPPLGCWRTLSRRWGPQCGWWGGHLPRREGMGTQRTATLTCWPPQPEEDVGHLISTLAARLWLGTPRINTFSGAMPCWERQKCPLNSGTTRYNVSRTTTWNSVVWESIVRSLKGAAGRYGPGTWVLPLVWPIFYRNWLLSLAPWHHLMSWCRTFTKLLQGNHEEGPLLHHKARRDPQPD